MADKMYTNHRLEQEDTHTLQCTTGGITYIPIPAGSDVNYVGLLSMDLPAVERKQIYTTVVRQITNARGYLPPDTTSIARAPLIEGYDPEKLRPYLCRENTVAMGEIGLDISSADYPAAEEQVQVLIGQLEMAIDLNLPVLLHCCAWTSRLGMPLAANFGKILRLYRGGSKSLTDSGVHRDRSQVRLSLASNPFASDRNRDRYRNRCRASEGKNRWRLPIAMPMPTTLFQPL